MTHLEKRWAHEVMTAIVPRDLAPGVEKIDYEGAISSFVSALPGQPELAVRAGIVLLQILPFFFIGRFCFLRSLDDDDRDRYLTAWYESNFYYFRQMALLVKMATCMAVFGERSVQEHLGFRPPEAWLPYGGGDEASMQPPAPAEAVEVN